MAIYPDGMFKGWVPVEYLDEIVPTCRAAPDDWLVRGDVLHLASASSKDDEDAQLGCVVAPEEIVVFCGNTSFGRITITLRSSFPLAYDVDRNISPNATMFWIQGDSDTISEGSLKAFVEMGALEGFLVIGEPTEVDCYDWTDRSFRLVDGSFVAVPT